MQKITDRKWAPVVCASAVIAILAVYLAIFLFAVLSEAMEQTIVMLILAIYSLMIIAVIAGVVIALRQRLREIDGGEEEIAKQY